MDNNKDKILIIENDYKDYDKLCNLILPKFRTSFQIIPPNVKGAGKVINGQNDLNEFLFGENNSNFNYEDAMEKIKNKIEKIILNSYQEIKLIILDMFLLQDETDSSNVKNATGLELLKYIRGLNIIDSKFKNWTKLVPIIVLTKADINNENYESLIKSEYGYFFANSIFNKLQTIDSDYDEGKNNMLKQLNFWNKYFSTIINIKQKIHIDIAVITALPEEIIPFQTLLDNDDSFDKKKIGNILYFKNKENNMTILTSIPQFMGMVDSAELTSRLFNQFNIDTLFMIGVCGGRKSKAGIGDIIIPKRCIAYLFGKIANEIKINPYHENSSGNFSHSLTNYDATVKNIIDGIKNEIIDLWKEKGKNVIEEIYKYYKVIDSDLINESNFDEVTKNFDWKLEVKDDDMACGDLVINKENIIDSIAKTAAAPKICAIDMESYSVCRVANIQKKEAIIIKSVMDLTEKKDDKFKDTAAYIAARFLYEIIVKGIYPPNSNS